MKDIHIGSIIRCKLEESPLSIAEFAERINRTRPTVYDIFNRKSIDTDLLVRISEVLDYDFLREVYLRETPEERMPTASSSRYIVGKEVSEQELKEYLDGTSSIILKILRE
ncbi:MAG: transcriptional regulator [Bacteroides sp.]|nr:transcriptional regulator [Bacteroides sp.]